MLCLVENSFVFLVKVMYNGTQTQWQNLGHAASFDGVCLLYWYEKACLSPHFIIDGIQGNISLNGKHNSRSWASRAARYVAGSLRKRNWSRRVSSLCCNWVRSSRQR